MIYSEKIFLCNHLGPGLFRQPKIGLAFAGVLSTEEPWPGSYPPTALLADVFYGSSNILEGVSWSEEQPMNAAR